MIGFEVGAGGVGCTVPVGVEMSVGAAEAGGGVGGKVCGWVDMLAGHRGQKEVVWLGVGGKQHSDSFTVVVGFVLDGGRGRRKKRVAFATGNGNKGQGFCGEAPKGAVAIRWNGGRLGVRMACRLTVA